MDLFGTTRFQRTAVLAITTAVVAFLLVANYYQFPSAGRPLVTVSPETTGFIRPLDKNGDVDYLKVINQQPNQAVRSDENALVLLLDGIGPTIEGSRLDPKFYELLGSPAPLGTGAFQHFYRWKSIYLANPSVPQAAPTDLDKQETFARSNPWKPEELPAIDAYIKAMQTAMATFDEAIEREKYYCPHVPFAPDDPIINIRLSIAQTQSTIGRLYGLEGMKRVGLGDLAGALEVATKLRKLARLCSQGSTRVEQTLVAHIETQAVEIEQKVLFADGVSTEIVAAHLKSITNLKNVASSVQCYRLSEPALMLDLAKRIGRGEQTLSGIEADWGLAARKDESKEKMVAGTIDWEHLMRRINLFYNEMAAATELPEHAKRLEEIDRILEKFDLDSTTKPAGLSGSMLSSRKERAERFFPKLFWFGTPPQFASTEANFVRLAARNRQTTIVAALIRYKQANDQFPDTLEQLTPEFLETIPLDPFAGKAMSYRKIDDESFQLYSVGRNRIDDGGKLEKSSLKWDFPTGADDLIFQPESETLESFLSR